MDHANNLTSAPIPKLIRELAIPTSIGFFFTTMFNVVDTYFAGLISTEAIAALTLSFPIFFIIIAMSSGTSTGATALITNALGEGDLEAAKDFAGQAISFALLVSAAVTTIGLISAPPIFRLLGAEGEYLELALNYINIILFGAVIFIVTNVMNATLHATGDTRSYRNYLVCAFFLNLVLDPWFLFGGFGLPALGISGIALATLVTQSVGLVYIMRKARATKLLNIHTLEHLIPEKAVYVELLRHGIPAGLNMIMIAVGFFIVTYFASIFGQAAVAAYGIAMRIEQMALLPFIGVNVATLILVGHNNGAANFTRVKETWREAIKFGCLITLPGGVIVFLMAPEFMGIFSADEQVLEIGIQYLRISVFIIWAYVMLFVSVHTLQGLKRPLAALSFGVVRQIVVPIPVIAFLVFVMDWELVGIWYGVLGVTWLSAIVAILYVRKILTKLS